AIHGLRRHEPTVLGLRQEELPRTPMPSSRPPRAASFSGARSTPHPAAEVGWGAFHRTREYLVEGAQRAETARQRHIQDLFVRREQKLLRPREPVLQQVIP